MAEAGFFARLRTRLFGEDDAPDARADATLDSDSTIEVSDEVGVGGGEGSLQGGPTVLEHPDLSTRLDVDPNPQFTQDNPDPGGTLPDDDYPQDDYPDGVDQIDGPPPPPDLTGGLDADPGTRYDLDLDLESDTPLDLPEPGPPLDLGAGDLGAGLDAPTVSPGLDMDPFADQPGEFDDIA
jgi:hypothetical protein